MLTVNAREAEGALFFFLRLGGATGAPTLPATCKFEASKLFCVAPDDLVLAMTSGSCRGRHAFSGGHSLCAIPVERVIVLGYWEYCFELWVDSESRELEERADTDIVFLPCSGRFPANAGFYIARGFKFSEFKQDLIKDNV